MRTFRIRVLLASILFSLSINVFAAEHGFRAEISLNEEWKTVRDTNSLTYEGFEKTSFVDKDWVKVDVPHNWDNYEGYRRMLHGNYHGSAWYRKEFSVEKREKGRQYFLFFEGVGSYATVWVNGIEVGRHVGGRTTFTIDVTDALNYGRKNILAVKADHPAGIRDLPWVCGGCSDAWGFSEGSQPLGIFRPVKLVITGDVRVEPFGVHAWNDTTVSEESAVVNVNTEVKNYSSKPRKVKVITRILNKDSRRVAMMEDAVEIPAGEVVIVKQISSEIKNPHLWSDTAPDLYRIGTEIIEGKDNILDRLNTFYGIRWISWPIGREGEDNKFYLNGKHVFLNGVCEYEHNMGMSHAFTDEQIVARIMQVKAAGFNAFRDAHQPHNLLYNHHWDRIGMLWWTQFSAQVWFDTPEFKENFKVLLREWVKERRNSPSIIMWGLQNESKLPKEFAQECTDIIREMDPTTSSQRLVSTCNGGTGTDWNVVQNWSGTYGGNPYNYAKDMETQLLNGEYGAWRSLDLHTEGPYVQDAPFSEDRMALLLELKVRLAEEARDKSCGQFQWILSSHENPGRTQNGEGFRELDRVGPVNYKGLFTPWGEPVDAYYMYRSNYASSETEPMVYIASHTWPDRWTTPGVKDGLIVYSNCDVVELWNDTVYLGYRERQGMGTHMQWDSIDVQFNTLRAIGFVNEKYVAEDIIMLNHLPKGPHFDELIINPVNNVRGVAGYDYIYRVNCGGPDYVDSNNKLWHADVHRTSNDTWGSVSWTDDYPGLPAFYASQRRSRDIISGTYDGELFQTFRYGREKLKYQFPVPNGDYRIELYFVEPWYGANTAISCKDWRVFDVAVNGETMIKDLDIWDKARYCYTHKEVLEVKVINGLIDISFPKVRVGQAIISAIAIAAKKSGVVPASASPGLITNLQSVNQSAVHKRWMDTGDKQYTDDNACFSYLPPALHGAEWLQMPKEVFGANKIASFNLTADADVFVAFDSGVNELPEWMEEYAFAQMYVENGKGQTFKVYNKRFKKDDEVVLGGNTESSLYLVSAVPITTLESASDLRPVNRLEAEDAKLEGENIRKDSIRTNGVVNFAEGTDNSVEFTFTVGVADTYIVRVRYINRTEETIPVNIRIVDAYDMVMRNDVMPLEPTVDDKFKTIKTDTGTQINAGTYKLTISNVSGVEGFILDYVEIQ